MMAAYGAQQHGRAKFSGRRKSARSRGASQNDVPRKQQGAGEEEEAKWDAEDADVMDLIIQAHQNLSTQLESRVRDMEAATYCTVFPPERERHRDRNAKSRLVSQRRGNKPP